VLNMVCSPDWIPPALQSDIVTLDGYGVKTNDDLSAVRTGW